MTKFDLSVGEVGAQMFLRGPGITDPTLDPEKALVTALGHAKKSIYALVFSISLPSIVAALKAAHDRGVEVHIVSDKTQAKSASSAVAGLAAYGIDIKLWGAAYQEAHDKVALIDGDMLITGSYNWTTLAEHSNIENMFILTGSRITHYAAPAYMTQWNNAYNAGATP